MVSAAIEKLRTVAATRHAVLRVVSPLAEGADRVVAQLALAQGAELIVPLPFARDVYLRDFSSASSREEFLALLARAARIIELGGSEAKRTQAYAAAGRAMVDQSDVVFALWDGERAAGQGGTAEIVDYAREHRKPVLWFPTVEAEPQLLVRDSAIAIAPIDAFLEQASSIIRGNQDSSSSRDRHLFEPGPKRILALDGGGVRGMLSIAMLEKLERVVEEIEGRPVALGDWFDLVGGTSTGAIIASFLSLGYRAAEIRTFYERLAPRVFQSSFWRISGIRSKFDSRKLAEELDKVFGDRKVGSDDIRTGLCIATKRLDTGSAWIIVNNPRGQYWDTPPDQSFIGNRHYRLANLIRASTAAPHYFDPQLIEVSPDAPPGLFIDGGVSPHNNPSLHLFLIATLPQYGLCWPLGPDNLTIVSVGTGSFRFQMQQNMPALARNAGTTIQALTSVLSDSQQMVLAIMSLFGETPMAWPINSELGDLGATTPPGGQSLFRFLRYDVRLEQPWLSNELGVAIEESELNELRRLEAAEHLARFHDLGARAAERQIRREHFDPRR